MSVSLLRMPVPEERAGEIVAASRRRAGPVEAFDGFVDIGVRQRPEATLRAVAGA